MEKKMVLVLIVLLVISLLANAMLLVLMNKSEISEHGVTGFLSRAEQENPVFENDIIELNKDELTRCCSFINVYGEEDGCYVLRGYDCIYCSDYCG